MEQYMWIVWLAVFVLAIITEAATAEITGIFLCLGSLMALILSLIPGVPFWVEIIVFVVLTVLSFIFLRPVFKKLFQKTGKKDTNVDSLIGTKCLVIKPYKKYDFGEVRVAGATWSIHNIVNEEEIPLNAQVEIVGIDGNKLIVKYLKEEE